MQKSSKETGDKVFKKSSKEQGQKVCKKSSQELGKKICKNRAGATPSQVVRLKITGSAHDVTGSRAIRGRDLSGSVAYRLGILAISWRAWILQRHVWEIRPLRLDDMHDQLIRADLVLQPLPSSRSPVW